MNCDKAREILNTLIDGEQHARADEARMHLSECAACREWHAGIERSLLLLESLRDDLPEADISAAVAASLPARHPASVRQTQTHAAGRVLAWVGVSWAAGAAMLVALLSVGLWAGSRYAQGVYGPVDTILTAVRALFGSISGVLSGLGDALVALIALIVPFAVLGAIMLAAALIIWRSRRRITGTPIVLC